MSQFIVDINHENAQPVLLDESFNRPVLVDFWADWCGPCKSIAPILDILADEYQGQVLIAKVNADEYGQIAEQFGVKNLPTLVMMKDGQPVDILAGAQTEAVLREFITKHLPSGWEADVQEAQQLIDAQEFEPAMTKLRQAYIDSQEHLYVRFMLIGVLIDLRRFDEAESLLSEVRMKDQDQDYDQLKARLELARNAEKAPEIQALEAKYAEDESNDEIIIQLAAQYCAEKHYQDALELLLNRMRKDINASDGEIKKEYLNIISVMGIRDPLAKTYQGKLYGLLY